MISEKYLVTLKLRSKVIDRQPEKSRAFRLLRIKTPGAAPCGTSCSVRFPSWEGQGWVRP